MQRGSLSLNTLCATHAGRYAYVHDTYGEQRSIVKFEGETSRSTSETITRQRKLTYFSSRWKKEEERRPSDHLFLCAEHGSIIAPCSSECARARVGMSEPTQGCRNARATNGERSAAYDVSWAHRVRYDVAGGREIAVTTARWGCITRGLAWSGAHAQAGHPSP